MRLIAKRIEQVQDPVIPIIGRLVAENSGTISLGQGVVHYGPPDEVAIAVTQAVDHDPTLDRYGDVRGIATLHQSIERKLAADNGIEITPATSVICTAGSNMAFLNSILAIADIGDEIILLSPYYFNHHMAVEIAGCRPVIVSTTSDYQLDVKAIENAITSRTRAVVTISPNNPTGAVYPESELVQVNALCRTAGIYHISDEAYEYFTYDEERHFSAGSIQGASEHTISLFSLSKTYGMAGWRTGYMVVPRHLVMSIKKIQDTNLICPPIVGQVAAAAALDVGPRWCRQYLEGLGAVRQTAIDAFSDFGARCQFPVPRGAFYVLLQLQTTVPDMTLVENLIRNFGVAVLPGSTFGVTHGCSIRLSYGALDADTVTEGIGRLRRGLLELL